MTIEQSSAGSLHPKPSTSPSEHTVQRLGVGAEEITNTVLGVPYTSYSIMGTKKPILIIKAPLVWYLPQGQGAEEDAVVVYQRVPFRIQVFRNSKTSQAFKP